MAVPFTTAPDDQPRRWGRGSPGAAGGGASRAPGSWASWFSTAAREVAGAARRLGLDVPGFRSPPALGDADRTLRRWPDGRCVVAVRARDRDPAQIIDDLIAGVVAANGLEGERAAAVEARLRLAVPPVGFEPTLRRV